MSIIRRRLELTLAILKPDLVANLFAAEEVKKCILRGGFHIIKTRKLHLTAEDAGKFYAEHQGKFFYNRLVTYMTSGPIVAHVLAKEEAITGWRKLMGPTKVYRTVYLEPESIRGTFGLSDTRNCTHGSDSPVTAAREMNFFFPDFNPEKWYSTQEEYFRKNLVTFDEATCEHLISSSNS